MYKFIEHAGTVNLDNWMPIEGLMNKTGTAGLKNFYHILQILAGLSGEIGVEEFNFGNGVAS